MKENVFTPKREISFYNNLVGIRKILESQGITKENVTSKKIKAILKEDKYIIGNFLMRIINEYPQDIWNETGDLN